MSAAGLHLHCTTLFAAPSPASLHTLAWVMNPVVDITIQSDTWKVVLHNQWVVGRLNQMTPWTLTHNVSQPFHLRIIILLSYSASTALLLSPQSHSLTSFHLLLFLRPSLLRLEFAEVAGMSRYVDIGVSQCGQIQFYHLEYRPWSISYTRLLRMNHYPKCK